MPTLWVLLFVACATYAQAQETSGFCGRQMASNTDSTNLTWQYDTSARLLTITGSGPMKDYSLATKAPWYDWHDQIQYVEIGDGVTTIGACALYQLSKVGHLHIPAGVLSIGDYALRDLSALDSISVDKNNPKFDSRDSCNALIETSSKRILLGCSKTRMPQTIRGIESYAFRKVTGLKKVVIPNGVNYIGTEAFNGCTALDSVVLPNQLTTIRAYTFQDCRSLDTIVFPENIDSIGIRAFANCSGLKYVRCNAIEPPGIDKTTFNNASFHIDVPCPGIMAYRNAPVWKDFDSLRISAWYELVLKTQSNNDAYGRDTILCKPACDTMAIICAEPFEGYEFVAWEDELGNILSKDSLYEFYVDEDMTVTAVFKKIGESLDNVMPITAVWVQERNVLLRTEQDTYAILYDLMGRMTDASPVTAGVVATLHAPTTGVYVVVTNGDRQKVIVR